MSSLLPIRGTPRPLPLSTFLEAGFPGFLVEGYQRAYKWQRKEVETLLHDVWSFTPSPAEESYCLQPIVVGRKADGAGSWEVIDGQQRMTTVYLILCFLQAELGGAPYSLQYKTRGATERLIRRIARWPAQPHAEWPDFIGQRRRMNNVDTFNLHEAWQTIARWFSEKRDGSEAVERRAFLEKLQACRVIWFEPTGTEAARAVFQRLNSGKLPLEDAELVKALFLRRHEEAEAPVPWQLELAREWDGMEAGLGEDRFWYLINPRPRSSAPVRMGFILDLLCDRRVADEDPHFCYLRYEKRFAAAEKTGHLASDRERAWIEVKACYSTLREWLEDPLLYHLTGFVTSAKQKHATLGELFRECRQRTKSEYRAWLRATVQRYVDMPLSELSYEKEYDKPRLHDVLLLFNLAPLTEASAATLFRFDLFHEQHWSLEHIHAQQSRNLPSPDWPDWLAEQRALLAEIAQPDSERLYAELDAWEKSPAAERAELQAELQGRLAQHYAEHLALEELHGLGNLALLSVSANAALGNRPFAVKRRAILKMSRGGEFIPLETVNAFLKSYTADPASLRYWSVKDRREYLEEIRGRLAPYRPEAPAAIAPSPPRPEPLAPASLRVDEPLPSSRRTVAPTEHEGFARLTFWLLLERWRVEIPLVQRDYAQGREEDPKATQIRTEFIRRLFGTLRGPSAAGLDLDLLFGKAVGARLIPLDGQQRLTTLFLLHWLLARRSGSDWATARRRLERFSYETRTSSRDFCRALCLENFELGPGNVRDQLTDQPWFSAAWLHDPSVRAMLHMLYDLDTAAERQDDAAALWSRLTAPHAPVFFHFLTLGSLGISDDLYLRLNARGRPLTDFEIFKAWFGGIAPAAEEKLDTAWADFFWRLPLDRDSTPARDVSDARFMRFFKAGALNEALAEKKSPLDAEKLVALFEQDYVVTDEYAGSRAFDDAPRARLLDLLDRLSAGGWEKTRALLEQLPFLPRPSILERFVAANVTFRERAFFHAFGRAVGLQDDRAFLRWMRVCRNLLIHTEPAARTLPAVVRTLETMAEGVGDIHAFLVAREVTEKDGLNPYQREEEHFKARLIQDNPAWEKPLHEAEDHAWFEGQIRFLFTTRDGHALSLEEFEARSAKARAVFAETGWVSRPDRLFHRALLSLGDYTLDSGPNYSLGLTKTEWQGWLQHEPLAARLWDLLDPVSLQNFESDFTARCAAYPGRDWRWFFIRSPHALASCPQLRFQWWPPGEYVLLHHTWRRTKHSRELRSHCLLERLQTDASVFPIGDWEVIPMGEDEDPHLALRHPVFAVEVRYKSDQTHYEITVRRGGDAHYLTAASEDEVLATLAEVHRARAHLPAAKTPEPGTPA